MVMAMKALTTIRQMSAQPPQQAFMVPMWQEPSPHQPEMALAFKAWEEISQ